MLGVALCIIHRVIFWNKTKLILNEGVFISNYMKLHKLQWLGPFVKLLYNVADTIIVPTHACKDDLVTAYAIHASRIVVLPNWTLIKKSSPLLYSKYDLIYVGRFDPEKNVESICDIVAELSKNRPQLRVLLIGSGEMLSVIQNRVLELHIERNIQIKNFSVQAPTFIHKSKILLLPSLNEGMPNVVLEAAMQGVPSVIANFKGSDEVVIHNKTGYIGNTTSQMITYIKLLLQNSKLRKKIGKNAQKFAYESFSQKAQQNFINTILE
jgi:glycosyltransferase involved in cell wall biosynthesis